MLLALSSSKTTSSKTVAESTSPLRQRKFKSARLIGTYDKPWTLEKDPRMFRSKVFF